MDGLFIIVVDERRIDGMLPVLFLEKMGISYLIVLIVGVILLASAIIGFFMTTMTKLERILFFSASLLLIDPGKVTDLIGLGIGILAMIIQKTRKTQKIPSP